MRVRENCLETIKKLLCRDYRIPMLSKKTRFNLGNYSLLVTLLSPHSNPATNSASELNWMQNSTSWVWRFPSSRSLTHVPLVQVVSQEMLTGAHPLGHKLSQNLLLTWSFHMRLSFSSLWGKSFRLCRQIAKKKGIMWTYTSYMWSLRIQSLVHLLPLPHSAQLWNFLLKSVVCANYHRLLLFPNTPASYPQGKESSDFQLKQVLKRIFWRFTLSEILIYVYCSKFCTSVFTRKKTPQNTENHFCFCKFPLIYGIQITPKCYHQKHTLPSCSTVLHLKTHKRL